MIKVATVWCGVALAALLGLPALVAHAQAPAAPPAQVAPAVPAAAPAPAAPRRHKPSPEGNADFERGRREFGQSCAFCHGVDATGARAPDLVRSPLVAHDVNGNLIGEVIRHGRPDKGMPPLSLTDEQVTAIAAFLHGRIIEAVNSSEVPEVYPVEKLLTGNAEAGKAYFLGDGGCKNCHSPAGDLAGVAGKFSPIELEAQMLYPEGHHKSVVVTLASGEQIQGPLEHLDDFVVALRDASGWYRSFPRNAVKVELQDHLAAHRELLHTLTQADVHNLFAYLQSLK
jgi:cytochrome c oxidase cbb3-type subunit 3